MNDAGKTAVNALVRDIAFLANGIEGKDPNELNFDSIENYLNLLVEETKRVKEGIYAKDNSIRYTAGDEISFTGKMIR